MKYEWRNLLFLKFSDSNFSHPGLCSKPTSENTDHSKPPNSLVINDHLSRLEYDELHS